MDATTIWKFLHIAFMFVAVSSARSNVDVTMPDGVTIACAAMEKPIT